MGLQENAATPYVGMVMATTSQVGLIIVSKRAMASGMTNYTFVAYSNALAALILLPLSLLVHRAANRPPLTFLLVCGFFTLGVLGCLAQLTGFTGINYTSAEFASAMLNLIPGFTFVLAVIFRMENLSCRSSSFVVKAIGTVVSIAGAFIVKLYKGPQILTLQSSPKLHYQYIYMPQSSWIIGGLFLAADCVFASGYIVVQGVFGSAFRVGVVSWCLHRRGPLFVAMFHPLGIVIAAAVGIIFLSDVMYLGSLAGSVLIVIGFYSVMWGKAKEVKVIDNRLNDEEAPLLQVKDEQMRT